jgi:hypothetical protein
MACVYLFGQRVQIVFSKPREEDPRWLAEVCHSLLLSVFVKGIKFQEKGVGGFSGVAAAIAREGEHAQISWEFDLQVGFSID